MKYVLSFLIAFSLLRCQQPEPQIVNAKENKISSEDSTLLRTLKEVEWPKAYREQDTLLLDRILADEFQMIDASGNVTDKSFELDWIKSNSTSYDSFYYDIKRFDLFDNGTAIMSGTGHMFTDNKETIYQSSNVLVKKDTIWKAVASHVSGIKPVEE